MRRRSDDVVGRAGFEPAAFPMSRFYGPLASASLHTYPYGCRGGIRTRILRLMRPFSYQSNTLQYQGPERGLAPNQGFEPRPPESESGVLPLHQSGINGDPCGVRTRHYRIENPASCPVRRRDHVRPENRADDSTQSNHRIICRFPAQRENMAAIAPPILPVGLTFSRVNRRSDRFFTRSRGSESAPGARGSHLPSR